IFRYNPDGTLDNSFGFDGIVLTGYYGDAAVDNSLAIQADGKILMVGTTDHLLNLMRYNHDGYNQDGSIDNTFGANGHVYIEQVSNEYYGYPSLDMQDDGKILTSVGMRNLLNQGIVMFRFNPDGSLDDSFGNNGKVKTVIGVLGGASAYSVKCQTDGKIVVCGDVSIDAVTVRYEADGAIDSTFGNNGIVLEDHFYWRSLIAQTDGKIVAAGYVIDAPWWSNFALARYNADGSPDYSFGIEGKVRTGLPSTNLLGYSVEIQTDGKLVLAGYGGPNSNDIDIVVARYNSNGTLDDSFGDDGITVINPGYTRCAANSIAIGSNDKYLIGGYAPGPGYMDELNLTMRLNLNGEVDSTFNLNGISALLKDSEDIATSITLVADSLIVVAGAADSTFSMVRYNLEWDRDYLFGRNGIVRVKTEGMPNSVVSQPDLKTILTGNSCLSRFNLDGSQDTSFGISGILSLDSVSLKQSHVQPDGKIVVSGNTTLPENKFIVQRFNPDGTPDTTFGSGGKTITGFGNYNDFVYSSFMQPDGKIILAGDTKISISLSQSVDFDFALVRYNTDGTPDSTFGNNGKVITSLGNSLEHCNSITLQSDGKILCTGNSDSSFVLIRYEANGEIDQTFASNGIFISTEIAHYGNKVFLQYEENMIMVLVDSVKLVRFNYDGTIDETFFSGPLFGGLNDALALPDEYIVLAGTYNNDFLLMIIPPGGFNRIQDKEEDVTKLFAYPNPVHDIINIIYELKDSEFVSIELYDITGRSIKQFKLNEFCLSGIHNDRFSLDNQLSPGIYLLQLSTRHSRQSVKIIKK
ncbi:MAG: T9SS type A sorting domain-containing protein, partial [Bacteroidales bacterium]|nr:T9SS type A sorting domain-containing protein [Bacteroidales bacterium]